MKWFSKSANTPSTEVEVKRMSLVEVKASPFTIKKDEDDRISVRYESTYNNQYLHLSKEQFLQLTDLCNTAAEVIK